MKPRSYEDLEMRTARLDSLPEPAVAGSPVLSDMASAYLDALRAIAANLVIGAHIAIHFFGNKSSWLGGLGVGLFFLLSGFLITQSMLNRLDRPAPWMGGYLADRTARILTPYIPALVLVALVNALFVGNNYAVGNGLNAGLGAFIGNLLMLQDHSFFQVLERGGIDWAWRIRPYNTAEPFWTVSIEMWIYVAAGLFVFCLLGREKIARSYSLALVLMSVPVVVWNAAAGGGKTLTLIWVVGAVAAVLFRLWRANGYTNLRSIGAMLILCGAVALVGRIGKSGFNPSDFQTVTLLAIALFGGLAVLMTVRNAPRALVAPAQFLASYSYSLYLVHNTVLIVVLENIQMENRWAKIVLAALLAHVCAYALYMAFERHHRRVANRLRPIFIRALAAGGR